MSRPHNYTQGLREALTNPKFKKAAEAIRDRMSSERGTKRAVEAFELMSDRNIWVEDAKRKARGVATAVTPPKFICCFQSSMAKDTIDPISLTRRRSLGQLPVTQAAPGAAPKAALSRRSSALAGMAGIPMD